MRYVIGGEASVEADQASWIAPVVGLVPEGCPGVVGPWVSGGGVSSPATRSSTTWSKLAVNVLAAVSPIWMRATGNVPVFVAQLVTIRTPSR